MLSFRRIITKRAASEYKAGKRADTMVLKKILGQRTKKKKAYRTEKRNFVRLVYPPDIRPVLKIGDDNFEVLNICEKGLKFLNHMGKPFRKQVFGKVCFHDGESIKIDGKILWENGPEVGLLVTNIPAFIIKQEIRTFIRKEASEDTLVNTGGATLEPARNQSLPEDDL